MTPTDYIILGGGISGLTFGRLLQQRTDKSFVLLEKQAVPGGLCRTHQVNGNDFDIGGGHFLYSKHSEVYDFIFSHLRQSGFTRFDRLTKIYIHGQYIDYPIEDNIWQLPKELQYEYAASLITSMQNTAEPKNFMEWAEKNLGKAICENYLIPYNRKVWGVEMEEMSLQWLYKIPAVKVLDIIKSIIYQKQVSQFPSHPHFYYPKKGGYQVIPDAIYQPTKASVRLNTPVMSIRKEGNNWIVNEQFSAPRIINTIPWGALPNLTHPDSKKLKHTTLVVSLHQKDYDHNWQWVYIPDSAIPYHREFYLNNYSLSNPDRNVSHETYVTRFKNNSDCLYHYTNEYAYPIPLSGYQESIRNILEYFEAQQVYGLGRWGQWEYHNSDVCIYQAIKLFGKLESKQST